MDATSISPKQSPEKSKCCSSDQHAVGRNQHRRRRYSRSVDTIFRVVFVSASHARFGRSHSSRRRRQRRFKWWQRIRRGRQSSQFGVGTRVGRWITGILISKFLRLCSLMLIMANDRNEILWNRIHSGQWLSFFVWDTRRWLALLVAARSPTFARPMLMPETTKNTEVRTIECYYSIGTGLAICPWLVGERGYKISEWNFYRHVCRSTSNQNRCIISPYSRRSKTMYPVNFRR